MNFNCNLSEYFICWWISLPWSLWGPHQLSLQLLCYDPLPFDDSASLSLKTGNWPRNYVERMHCPSRMLHRECPWWAEWPKWVSESGWHGFITPTWSSVGMGLSKALPQDPWARCSAEWGGLFFCQVWQVGGFAPMDMRTCSVWCMGPGSPNNHFSIGWQIDQSQFDWWHSVHLLKNKLLCLVGWALISDLDF